MAQTIRPTAAEQRAIAQKLAASVLWQAEFAARGDTHAAQNELDYSRELAQQLLDPNGTDLFDRLEANRCQECRGNLMLWPTTTSGRCTPQGHYLPSEARS